MIKGYSMYTYNKKVLFSDVDETADEVDGELYDDIDFDLSLVRNGIRVYRP